jgi:Methane oxygenase PmoA
MLKNFKNLNVLFDKMAWVLILLVGLVILLTNTMKAQRIKVIANETTKTVDISFDNQPFTSFFNPGEDILKKPVLYPLRTSNGTIITRGWPIDPRPGERVDHPHHVGMWLNYEDVNGFDYWNNSTAIEENKRVAKYGTIRQLELVQMKSGGKQGSFKVRGEWISADGRGDDTMIETTEYIFSGKGDQRIIDRITTLVAERDVVFKDVKDGMFAIRVARELELPSKTPEIFTDASGIETKVPMLNNDGVTGNYRSSEGLEGEKVWGTRGRWVNLSGKIKSEDISLAIIDHPKNVGYPTYWHARGYGLFAANPLGANVFSNGKEATNLKLKKGEKVTFRYRTVISSRKVTDDELNKLAKSFAKLK